jgi:hypothetical protein
MRSTFTADLAGVYVATLVVNDGKVDSQAVQGETSGKLNIPAVLGYGVKTTPTQQLQTAL